MTRNTRLNIREVLKELEIKKVFLFSPQTFARLFKVKVSTATIFLSRNTRLEYFVRLKKGLYSLQHSQPSALELANTFYKPSYLSLEIALSFYHVIPETVYSITSITTKHSNTIKASNQMFIYHKVSRNLYFGYQNILVNNKKVMIAVKEKALLDYLYFVARGQKRFNDRFDLRSLDTQRLSQYSKMFLNAIRDSSLKKRFAELLTKISV